MARASRGLIAPPKIEIDPSRLEALEVRIASLEKDQQRVFEAIRASPKVMTVVEVAEAAKVTPSKLRLWLQNPFFYGIWEDYWYGVLKFYAPFVARVLTERALEGNIEAIRLFFELMGWQQKMQVDMTVRGDEEKPIPISIVKAPIDAL